MQVFEDRSEAGRELAKVLRDRVQEQGRPVVVLAVPRGGLPVAAEVVAELGADFDVAVVRKLRSPHNPEVGFGAVGADAHVEIDESLVRRLGLTPEQVAAEVADRREAVVRRLATYRAVTPVAELGGATVVVVDDGVATGGTAREACALARRGGAARLILAVPVAAPGAVEQLSDAADEVVVLSTPAEFLTLGQAYRHFSPIGEEEALAYIRAATEGRSPTA